MTFAFAFAFAPINTLIDPLATSSFAFGFAFMSAFTFAFVFTFAFAFAIRPMEGLQYVYMLLDYLSHSAYRVYGILFMLTITYRQFHLNIYTYTW